MPNAYAVLSIQLPSGQEDAWPVTQPTLTLGRSSSCQVILDDASVSRQHVEVSWTAHGAQVRDLGSANGTWLNDQMLLPRVLYPMSPGDALRIGPFSLRFMPPAEPFPPAVATHVRVSAGAGQPQPGLADAVRWTTVQIPAGQGPGDPGPRHRQRRGVPSPLSQDTTPASSARALADIVSSTWQHQRPARRGSSHPTAIASGR